MKRSLSLFLASLMLVFALTACGRKDDTPQSNSQDGGQNESAVVGDGSSDNSNNGSSSGNSSNGSSSNGSGNSGNNSSGNGSNGNNSSLLEDAGNAVEDGLNGMENAVDGMTDSGAKTRSAVNHNVYNQRLNSTGTLMQNGNPVTFQNPVLPGIF